MLSLFPRANAYTLQVRRDHIQERDTELWANLLTKDQVDLVRSSPDRPISVPSTAIPTHESLCDEEIELQPGDAEILSSDIQALVHGIDSGSWTAARLLHAFVRSSRRAQRASNCITIPAYRSALARAQELDKHFARTGKLAGPLHGVPFSIKDNMDVRGLPTSVGYTSWLLHGRAKKDSSWVAMIRELGGVILCKTNVPQTMLSFECFNPVYGRTSNPSSAPHTCGGSSGGEAALLASDGSAAGIGSDIGGSLRIPAGYCGIYAIKPSFGRFPTSGARTARGGFEGIAVSVAPLCRSAADLQYLLEVFIPLIHPSDGSDDPHEVALRLGAEALRNSPLRASWLSPLTVAKQRSRPIRLGYYVCDGFIQTTPACIRGTLQAVQAVREKYTADMVELAEIDPSRLKVVEAMHIYLALVTSDSFSGLLGPLRAGRIKEAMDWALFLPVFAARGPRWLKKISYWIARYLVGDWQFSHLLAAGGGKTAEEYFDYVQQRDDFTRYFNEQVWDHYALDGIICPLQASPALPHGGCTNLSTLAASTAYYNVLDTAIAVCPVGRVDATLDALPSIADSKSKPSCEDAISTTSAAISSASTSTDQVPMPSFPLSHAAYFSQPGMDTTSALISHSLYDGSVYEPQKMSGLPLSVQVIARKGEEEKCVGLMRLVDDALRDQGVHEKFDFGPGRFSAKSSR